MNGVAASVRVGVYVFVLEIPKGFGVQMGGALIPILGGGGLNHRFGGFFPTWAGGSSPRVGARTLSPLCWYGPTASGCTGEFMQGAMWCCFLSCFLGTQYSKQDTVCSRFPAL